MDKYYKTRKGGRRESFHLVWRNAKLNGQSFTWASDWVLPGFGVLEVDYVYMLRPTADASPVSGSDS